MRLHAPFWCSAARRKASGGGTSKVCLPNLGGMAVNEPAGGAAARDARGARGARGASCNSFRV